MRRSNVGKLLFAGVLLIAAGNGCGKNSTLPPVKLKPGSLEFCIVANDIDDDIAIAEAKDFFEKAFHDPKLRSELKQAAEEGKPPPPPRSRGLRFFFNGHDTTFRWVELDRKNTSMNWRIAFVPRRNDENIRSAITLVDNWAALASFGELH
jgi:hypothetical protein